MKRAWYWIIGVVILIFLIIYLMLAYRPPMSQESRFDFPCSINHFDCSDFLSWSKANYVFESCGGVNNDIHQLDEDGDGIPCEELQSIPS